MPLTASQIQRLRLRSQQHLRPQRRPPLPRLSLLLTVGRQVKHPVA